MDERISITSESGILVAPGQPIPPSLRLQVTFDFSDTQHPDDPTDNDQSQADDN